MSNNNIQKNVILVVHHGTKDTSKLLNALQSEDLTILTAQDSLEALAIATSELPQMIVIDLTSSARDGWQICQQLKENILTNKIAVILTGAVADTASQIKQFNWDKIDYILAPTQPEEVVTRINTHLALRNLAQQSEVEKHEAQIEALNFIPIDEAAKEDLSKFATLVFNDLQAPLDSLKKFTESLSAEYEEELDAQADEYIAQLADSDSEIEALKQQLMIYSQMGKSEETWIAVNLETLVQEVTQDLQAKIAAEEAIIIVGNLPTVLVNPQEMSQLFANLIENSLKFRSEQQPRIEITGTQRQQDWLIEVKDNGIGIDPKYQELIFELFHRLHPPETYSGYGIGLAICDKIVYRYGGEIWVESALGQGATFYFTIPNHFLPHKILRLESNYLAS